MKPVQAVLLDFGGVIYRTPDFERWLRWLRLFGIRDLSMFNMLSASPNESDYIRALWTGEKQENEVWDEISQRFKMRPGLLWYLRRQGISPRHLNKEILDYLAHLRRSLPTAILTNAGTQFRDTFVDKFELEKLVDQVIISAEEGLCKPDPEIYLLAADRIGLPPEQILFVDDMPENVAGAQEVGMQSFQFTSPSETIQRMQAIINQ